MMASVDGRQVQRAVSRHWSGSRNPECSVCGYDTHPLKWSKVVCEYICARCVRLEEEALSDEQ